MARILLVDDNAELLKLLEVYLTSLNHLVICATDGHAAMMQFEEGRFDVLITDLMMPNKEGLETICEVRAQDPNIGIIAMSGGGHGAQSLYLRLADSFGAQTVLVKPFSLKDLDLAIEKVLGATLQRSVDQLTMGNIAGLDS